MQATPLFECAGASLPDLLKRICNA